MERVAAPYRGELMERSLEGHEVSRPARADATGCYPSVPALRVSGGVLGEASLRVELQAVRLDVERREDSKNCGGQAVSFQLEPITKEQSADIAAVLSLRSAPHSLGDKWPLECRTAYDIGYMDGLLAGAELLSNRYADRNSKGAPAT